MISGIDSNILLDILIPDPIHVEASRCALAEATRAGATVISEPVYGELAARFTSLDDLTNFLSDTRVRLAPSGPDALYEAGRVCRAYRARRSAELHCSGCGNRQMVSCERCGSTMTSRQHVLADFMIGAHALVYADRLLTRDRGYYSTYFPQLILAS